MSQSHLVIYQDAEGKPGYRQFETIDESVAFVESIRNEQFVTNARIFRLEEVRFEFKPYYRVAMFPGDGEANLASGDEPAVAVDSSQSASQDAEPATADAPEIAVADDGGHNSGFQSSQAPAPAAEASDNALGAQFAEVGGAPADELATVNTDVDTGFGDDASWAPAEAQVATPEPSPAIASDAGVLEQEPADSSVADQAAAPTQETPKVFQGSDAQPEADSAFTTRRGLFRN